MKHPHVLAAALLACMASAAAGEPAAAGAATPTFADAMRAYYAQDYPTCASILAALGDSTEPAASRIAYNAARCLALAGRIDAAFKALERATDPAAVRGVDLDEDPDLAALRADAAWPAFRTRAAQREQARLDGVDRALRDELLVRSDRGTAVRDAVDGSRAIDAPDGAEATRIDADNTAWLKKLIARRGWPGKSLVLKDGAHAAWRLAMRADSDLALQKRALALLDAAVAKGEAESADLAALVDHVLVAEGKPQRYGTRFHVVDGVLLPYPIEDEANVDLLRAFAGLPSLTEYKKALRRQPQRDPAPP